MIRKPILVTYSIVCDYTLNNGETNIFGRNIKAKENKASGFLFVDWNRALQHNNLELLIWVPVETPDTNDRCGQKIIQTLCKSTYCEHPKSYSLVMLIKLVGRIGILSIWTKFDFVRLLSGFEPPALKKKKIQTKIHQTLGFRQQSPGRYKAVTMWKSCVYPTLKKN